MKSLKGLPHVEAVMDNNFLKYLADQRMVLKKIGGKSDDDIVDIYLELYYEWCELYDKLEELK